MQQHSQIVELKDRLVQALDEEFNVKNLQEVKRIVATLEKTHVTLEDLERTRLGRYINGLRRKTTDKELAKRSKKLIKSWRDATSQGAEVGGGGAANHHSNLTTPNASLTSPFNPNSAISPPSLSNDSFSCNSSYAPTGSNGYSNALGNKGISPNGGSHPALLRIRNQHLTSPQKSKLLSGQLVSPSQSSNLSPSLGGGKTSFRPHSQTASPRESFAASQQTVNGHHKASQRSSQGSRTSPVNVSSLTTPAQGKNGLSPGLRNSFKNILARDGISPSSLSAGGGGGRRRTTPPMPSSALLSSAPDSNPSSRHCSPLAFFSNDNSRDSTSLQSHKSHSSTYSNQGEFSPPDTADEDSNSSVFSNLSADGTAAPGRSLLDAPSAKNKRSAARKRKLDSESDALRENLNTIIMSGGRRLQSTKELAQKFNVNLGNSLSASSSPAIDTSSAAKRAKLSRNGGYNNGFHHGDEHSLSGLERRGHKSNHSLPASPALLSLRNVHSATTSPTVQSNHSYDYEEDDDELYSKASSAVSKHDKHRSSAVPSPDDGSVSFDFAKAKSVAIAPGRPTITKIDRDIAQIYQRLPPVNPIDAALMENFKFEEDEDEVDASVKKQEVDESMTATVSIKEEKQMEFDGDEDEYELFEYLEEYEEEVEEEVEVTDDEAYSSDADEDEFEEVKSADLVTPRTTTTSDACVQQTITNETEALDSPDYLSRDREHHTMGDINNCDTTPTAVDEAAENADRSQSQSTAVAVADNDPQQVMDESPSPQPDSTNSCDDPNDAIPSSTTSNVIHSPVEADSTTISSSAANMKEEQSNSELSSPDCTYSTVNSLGVGETAVKSPEVTPIPNSFYTELDFLGDIELLNYEPPSFYLYEEFPTLAKMPEPLITGASSEQDKEKTLTQGSSSKPADAPPASSTTATKDPQPTQPSPPSLEEKPKVESLPPSPMDTSDVERGSFTSSDEDDDELSDAEEDSEELPEPQPPTPPPVELKRKRTKRVLRPVLKKKYRKRVARSRVKRALIDKLAETEWEFVNGTYDKDGQWRDFGEMTSAYVLRGGENAANRAPENVLYILPYANYSW